MGQDGIFDPLDAGGDGQGRKAFYIVGREAEAGCLHPFTELKAFMGNIPDDDFHVVFKR